ncbi:hypothetical protein PAXRUDRAFT_363280 [Paxillus rubicundulus Ve08.2h10]|uniref:Uncharacterized protein n=1 Tax=Paxillus rubicundulus Ve08.2h10 TaxID=930991 RepID=A0A0D0E3W6_9AGAM|nr:hypothetical protein PAXRUDRAFT_363280 [Paxillus rubicundulus Ve08.2h10]
MESVDELQGEPQRCDRVLEPSRRVWVSDIGAGAACHGTSLWWLAYLHRRRMFFAVVGRGGCILWAECSGHVILRCVSSPTELSDANQCHHRTNLDSTACRLGRPTKRQLSVLVVTVALVAHYYYKILGHK